MSIYYICMSLVMPLCRSIAVKSDQGWLEGEEIPLFHENGTYYSFKGIPYARPPVGQLRFKEPERPPHWEGIRRAVEHGPICRQAGSPNGSEDCLYLNVYTPPNITPATPYPVMVYIHGGSFVTGSGNSDFHSPDFLIPHGVILVTFNYRLEILGFLSLNRKYLSGNNGLKDQVSALKWVRSNIYYFGGDPSDITVFGQDAGAASVGFHLISPMSAYLFNKAILMSGSPLSDWAMSIFPRELAFILGQKLGFYTKNDCQLIQYLKKQDVKCLVNQRLTFSPLDTIGNDFIARPFGPCLEKSGKSRYLPGELDELVNKSWAKHVDIIMGYVNEEGMIAYPAFSQRYQDINRFFEYFLTRRLAYKADLPTAINLGIKIKQHYLGKKKASPETNSELSKFFSWSAFKYDIQKFLKILPKSHNAKRYLYKYSAVTERNWNRIKYGPNTTVLGVCHNDDLPHIFHQPAAPGFEIGGFSHSLQTVRLMTTMWTNFAKYGNPTPNATEENNWPQWNASSEQYIDIHRSHIQAGVDLDYGEFRFWDDMYWELLTW